ncbi:low molecular weight protein arginine phosphatase [Bacillus solitudinis]|uniref:low molecular weight protein arginine phosphatase n=1 Tax=Bacillus solitudinis TaxID=2014074 RepID=UPI000C24ACC7|nr:low molecular weight protein arginine phosphatase [Bacillus solitudinis]
MAEKRVLFVCTGNTCRSPLAEALLREKAGDSVEVKSAGVQAFPGESASEGTRRVLEKRGITLQHQAQMVTAELVEWADLILTMTVSHRDLVVQHYQNNADKVYTLKEYAGKDDLDISDPIGGPLEAYEKTAQEIEQSIKVVIKND